MPYERSRAKAALKVIPGIWYRNKTFWDLVHDK